jgi:hypothetical protein
MDYRIYKVDGSLSPDEQDARRKQIAERVAQQRIKDAEKHKPYHSPRTGYEWWDVVREWWPEMFNIAQLYLSPLDMQLILDIDAILTPEQVAPAVVQLKENRDISLSEAFHAAWAAAPDRGEIHFTPGWHVFCDLCSRTELLYENYNTMLPPEEAVKLHS